MFVPINKNQRRLSKMVNSFNQKLLKKTFLILLLILTGIGAFAQKTGYIQVSGKIKQSNKPESGVTVQISAPGAQSQTVASKDNGSFDFNLDLQKNYTIKFFKNGLVTKLIEFNTTVPPDQTDIIYQKEFNIDLFADVAGVSQDKAMNKSVAKFAYNPTYEDFEYDQNYSKQILNEQDQARKTADELNKIQERARLDSLNRVWNDSLAKVKTLEAERMAKKAEQDRLTAEREKARQDSITRANAAASAANALAERDKAKRDSLSQAEEKARALAEAKEKERQDSIARAKADQERQNELAASKEKARQDSLAQVEAARLKADALAKERADAAAKAKAEADALANENARKDALAKAELAEKQRKQQIADSTEKANADARRAEELAQLKDKQAKEAAAAKEAADKLRAENELRAQEKAKQDALDQAKAKEAADKLRAENELRAQEKAKQDALDQAKAKEAADKLRAENELKAKEKAKQDAIQATRDKELADAKIKADADAKAKADADAKQKADADAKAKVEAEKASLALAEKNRQDSITAANRAAAAKEEADRQAKAYAEIEAKKKLLGKTATKPEDKGTTATASSVPKIVDSDYKDGLTDETIKEANRTIYRTVVKKDGSAINYQKVVYNWGGVFYFKNDNSMTELTFQQELNNFKADFK